MKRTFDALRLGGVLSQPMDLPKPAAPKQTLTGDGPPSLDLKAPVGQRYHDRKSQRVWEMTSAGWVKLSRVVLDVLPERKKRWLQAADKAGISGEAWVVRTLDRATISEQRAKPSDAS